MAPDGKTGRAGGDFISVELNISPGDGRSPGNLDVGKPQADYFSITALITQLEVRTPIGHIAIAFLFFSIIFLVFYSY